MIEIINISRRVLRIRGGQPLSRWEVKPYPESLANRLRVNRFAFSYAEFKERLLPDTPGRFPEKTVKNFARALGVEEGDDLAARIIEEIERRNSSEPTEPVEPTEPMEPVKTIEPANESPFASMSPAMLRQELEARGLNTKGNKTRLIARLEKAIASGEEE